MRSPYLLVFTFFLVWMAFFDENNLAVQWNRKREIAVLDEKISFYRKGIDETKREFKELTTNPETQEKFAREHYYMKRDNEEVFVFRTFEAEQEKPKRWWEKIFR